MYLIHDTNQGATTMTTTTTKPAHAVASFMLHDNHRVQLRADKSVTCETCSLSATVAAAVAFMYDNGVIRLTLDGAPLKRI